MKTKKSIVKESIKSKIIEGIYVPNQKIHSESQLMKQFGVSRHTVRLAIGELAAEGWLYREQGSGTFCADRSAYTDQSTSRLENNIAIITTYISDYIFPSIIRGAEARLSEEGYQVSIFSTNNDSNIEKTILEKILSQNFDGVIVEPTRSTFSNPNIGYYLELERLSIPYIMINAFYEELEPVSIVMDDEAGGFLQTDHLIKNGHKKILGFFKTDDIQGKRRMKGFLKAFRKNNLPIIPDCLITYSTEEKDTKPAQELERILSKQEATGIVCYNDELAMKLIQVLRQMKKRIPEDISIVGYDDSILAQVSEVKLTTISHPKSKMGEDAALKIINLINSKQNKTDSHHAHSITYNPELIIRSSTKEVSKENF